MTMSREDAINLAEQIALRNNAKNNERFHIHCDPIWTEEALRLENERVINYNAMTLK